MLQESVWQLSVEMYKIEKPEKKALVVLCLVHTIVTHWQHIETADTVILKKQQTRQQEEPKTTHYKTKHKVYLTKLILCQMALKQTKD